MSYNRCQPFQFLKGQMWDPAQSDQKSVPNPVNMCDHVPSTHVPRCLVISYTRISRGPSQHKKWILKQQVRVPLNIPKHSTKISCQWTNPFRHLARATPKTTRKPFQGHGRRCRSRPPWPPQRSAARPRRHGLPEPPNAAPSSLGRRGCDAEGGAAAAAVEKQSVANGMFLGSGLLGKKMWIGHIDRR